MDCLVGGEENGDLAGKDEKWEVCQEKDTEDDVKEERNKKKNQ